MAEAQGELKVYERPEVRRPGSRLVLVQATSIVALLTAVSKVFGFAREASLAASFGAAAATDAYLVAHSIPIVLFSAGTALGLAFIPVFAEVCEKEGFRPAYRTACTVLNVTFGLGCIVLLIGLLCAGLLVKMAAPGFHGDVFRLTVTLTRFMLPIVVLHALNGFFAGMLQTQGNFAVPAGVVILFNAVIIFSTLALGPLFGIEAVAVGTTIAVAIQCLTQFAVLWRRGFRWSRTVTWDDPHLRRWSSLVVPVIVTSSASQLALLVERMLASRLAEGSISALSYAHRLVALPHGVVGLAISVVLYPTLSRFAAGQNWSRFRGALAAGVRMAVFLLVPVVVIVVVLREPIVRLAFERGAFDEDAVGATAYALAFMAVGIFGFSMRDVLTRAFFARQDMRTPMYVAMASVVVSVALSILLVRPLGHGGLALATVSGTCFGAVAMLVLLAPSLGRSLLRIVLQSLFKVLLASLPMAFTVVLAAKELAVMLPGGGVALQILRLAGATAAGMVLYFGLLVLFRLSEARFLVNSVASLSRRALARPGGAHREAT